MNSRMIYFQRLIYFQHLKEKDQQKINCYFLLSETLHKEKMGLCLVDLKGRIHCFKIFRNRL